jgi:bifunctional UDP-N-acetylglucosamine pyrophosphorylase / glucosamine-1-phosphate N-acetyltransferase
MVTRSVILAAGQGTRMRSALPKVLHPLSGHPLAWYALEAARQATGAPPVLIVGHGAHQVRQQLGEAVQYVVQEQQLGTGHAVLQARPVLLGQSDWVLVTYADMPLLRLETLRLLIQAQEIHPGPMTILTVIGDDPRGFGRVVRGYDGRVVSIIEEAHASQEQLAIREYNVSVYCFNAAWLWKNIDSIPLSPKGEYYLTDMVGIATAQGLPVQAIVAEDAAETIGINTRVHLAEAETALRRRINEGWMLAGVTLVDPASVYIEPEVMIGQDTVIWPGACLQGQTTIGSNCTIGPNSILVNTKVGNSCRILASVLEGAILEDGVEIGPFGHLRKGAHLDEGVHMGNFGEVKNSYLGPGTKMGHFSYLGDATIGPGVNIGAGTITCNYDGSRKHPTEIGAGAFIGCDTMLVAPVKLGEGARTGAGSVVTKDIPPHSLAVGAPARAIQKIEKRD